eukprot:m.74881 g.74881  ORF g.74881 m.74881 type:complete len:513 (+) comp16161_c0_seq2:180-1718(+)
MSGCVRGFVATEMDSRASAARKRRRVTTEKCAAPPDINVWICEDHNEALQPIQRLLGSKKIPFSNLAMVHFDGHPDLLLPKDLPADSVFDKEIFNSDNTDIAEWILPLVYAGHVRTVVWIKPYWCNQIEDGVYTFHVGKHTSSGKLRVDSGLPYFIDELLSCPTAELSEKKPLDLYVCTLGETTQHEAATQNQVEQSCGLAEPVLTAMSETTATSSSAESETCCTHGVDCNLRIRTALAASSGILLDVCLDFFSTANPFRADVPPSIFEALDGLNRCHSASSRAFYDAALREQSTHIPGQSVVLRRVVPARQSFLKEMTGVFTAAAGVSTSVGTLEDNSENYSSRADTNLRCSDGNGHAEQTRARDEHADSSGRCEELDAYVRAVATRMGACTASPARREHVLLNVAAHLAKLVSDAPPGTTINPARLASIACTTDLPHRISSAADIQTLLADMQTWLRTHWPVSVSAHPGMTTPGTKSRADARVRDRGTRANIDRDVSVVRAPVLPATAVR